MCAYRITAIIALIPRFIVIGIAGRSFGEHVVFIYRHGIVIAHHRVVGKDTVIKAAGIQL